jgi:hypothetical protein
LLIKLRSLRIQINRCPGRFSIQDKRCEGCAEVMDPSTPCYESFINELKRWWRALHSMP